VDNATKQIEGAT